MPYLADGRRALSLRRKPVVRFQLAVSSQRRRAEALVQSRPAIRSKPVGRHPTARPLLERRLTGTTRAPLRIHSQAAIFLSARRLPIALRCSSTWGASRTWLPVRDTGALTCPCSKNFTTLREQYIQLRVDAFNLFNHPTWNNPSTSNTSPTGGLITGPKSFHSNTPDARFLQLSAKYTF